MERLVACCGITCSDCPAFIAAKTDDDGLRKKTAAEWSQQYGADIKPEDVNCAGCTVTEGPHIGHWSECGIRQCCSGRGVENCARCDDYACDQLAKFLEMVPAAKQTLDGLRQ